MRWRKEKYVMLLKAELRFLGRPVVKILSSPFSSDDKFTFTEFPKGEKEKQHTGGRNSWCPRPSACFSARNGQVLKNSDRKKKGMRQVSYYLQLFVSNGYQTKS